MASILPSTANTSSHRNVVLNAERVHHFLVVKLVIPGNNTENNSGSIGPD